MLDALTASVSVLYSALMVNVFIAFIYTDDKALSTYAV
jgi:hypothetical protein